MRDMVRRAAPFHRIRTIHQSRRASPDMASKQIVMQSANRDLDLPDRVSQSPVVTRRRACPRSALLSTAIDLVTPSSLSSQGGRAALFRTGLLFICSLLQNLLACHASHKTTTSENSEIDHQFVPLVIPHTDPCAEISNLQLSLL